MATVTIPWKTPPEPPAPEPKTEPKEPDSVILYASMDLGKESTTEDACFVLPEGTTKCSKCGEGFPKLRADLLHVDTCLKCTPPSAKLFGVMDYGHKTAGSLMLIQDQRTLKMLRRPANRQR